MSSEEEERKIRSGKTKRLEALEKILDDAKKHANIQDFEQLLEDFDRLGKEIINQEKTMIEEYGDRLPSRVLKTLVLVDETITEVTKPAQKKFNKTKATAYTKLKQRLKKYLTENGEDNFQY